MEYKVKTTNGIWCKVEVVKHHDDWANSQESAEKMVQAMMNSSWKVIK